MTIANNSITDTYRITWMIDFTNSFSADGPDAFADSELTLDVQPPSFPEDVFSDLVSDTSLGDRKNGSPLGTSGALVVDNGSP
ncbi:MAG: hypothetical protein VBE63_23870 [Lamprobacter sp.]|uniref:hypothetical protein n=1 Tax=Lamprobacter sp. TaxID=3100796 RepID=UPI002B25DC38|nr:hypothetical protein [Lamprobacter sp.]MEA3642954.1 hypothetical protein [Lamprobacter sp.]